MATAPQNQNPFDALEGAANPAIDLGNDVDKFVGSTYQTLEITKAPGLKDNILKNSNI